MENQNELIAQNSETLKNLENINIETLEDDSLIKHQQEIEYLKSVIKDTKKEANRLQQAIGIIKQKIKAQHNTLEGLKSITEERIRGIIQFFEQNLEKSINTISDDLLEETLKNINDYICSSVLKNELTESLEIFLINASLVIKKPSI